MLIWEQTDTDDPGDQTAASTCGLRGYWSLGPNSRGWSVELIERDVEGNERYGVHLGYEFPSEQAAKAAAEGHEHDHGGKAADDVQVHPYFGAEELNEPDDERQTDRHRRVWTRRGIGGDVVVWEREGDPDAYDWTLVVNAHGPMSPVLEPTPAGTPMVRSDVILRLVESSPGCGYRFCDGPDVSIVTMKTCHACGFVIELRAVLREAGIAVEGDNTQ